MTRAAAWLAAFASPFAIAACLRGGPRITEPVGVDDPNRPSKSVAAPNPSVESTPNLEETRIGLDVHDRAEQRCKSAVLASPHFALMSAEVRPEDNAEIRALADCLIDGPLAGATVVLVGHADGGGDEIVDEKLARARAEQVTRFLVARGVPRANIRIRATVDAPRPANEPSFTGDDSIGWSSRRVDVFIAQPQPSRPTR